MGVTETNLGELVQRPEKPIYWHQVVVKDSIVYIAGTKQEGTVYAPKIWTSRWLSGKSI